MPNRLFTIGPNHPKDLRSLRPYFVVQLEDYRLPKSVIAIPRHWIDIVTVYDLKVMMTMFTVNLKVVGCKM